MEVIMNNHQAQPVILPQHIHDNQNGLDYTLHGNYYLPDISFPKRDSRPIGKWGRMHEWYLREHKPVLYNQLVLQGRLGMYLAVLNEQTQKRLYVLTQQMKYIEGVDERMKARDQQEWIGQMNNIRQKAEESVMAELIFI